LIGSRQVAKKAVDKLRRMIADDVTKTYADEVVIDNNS
jgi:hypothetical protein